MHVLLCSLLKPANLARREIGKSTMNGLLDAGLSRVGLLDAGLPNDLPGIQGFEELVCSMQRFRD